MNFINDKYINIPHYILNKLVYDTPIIKTPYNTLKTIYADYTASGRPSPIIDNYLKKYIYPYYSNTHSNAYHGIYMKNKIKQIKKYLRTLLNINNDYIILFPGNGTTTAINHLSNSIDYYKYDKVVIFLTLYEHYSNFLPWLKKKEEIMQSKKSNNIIIEYISLINDSPLLNLNSFEKKLSNYYIDRYKYNTLVICSFIACSNVTGMELPLDNIKSILNKYNNDSKFHKYFFVDFACSAPYVNIDCSKYDAIFFSPHKFIGGMSTPGILIGRKCLFMQSCPFVVGGGCVKNSFFENITYENDIEIRESAGTPNIIGIIKLLKIFQIKTLFMNIINNNETILNNILNSKINYLINKYNNFFIILYPYTNKLPIISFSITNLHYNLVVKLFDDLFGIQTRGGISCCGLLANYIKKKI